MSQKVREVLRLLSQKKSNTLLAEKAGLNLDEFLDIKNQVLVLRRLFGDDDEMIVSAYHNLSKLEDTDNSALESSIDIEKGTATFKATVSEEPKSPEDIIRLLNIDTDEWKLSQYWNKQRSDGWFISALVSKKKHEESDYLEHLIKNWSPKPTRITQLASAFDETLENTAAVISLQDIHFGKEGNHSIADDFISTVVDLVSRAKRIANLDKVFYVVGGDLLNMDTFAGTTTSGTPVSNSQSAMDTYVEAFDALHWSIGYIKSHCRHLDVVYIPGNHDRLSSFHLAHALSKSYEDMNITWHVDYTERRVLKYGDNFFAFEHGDTNTKNSLLIYATENPSEWGSTKYRTLYTGHLRTKKKIEYITEDEKTGFSIKILPSLSRSDYWHYHNKFTGNKRAGVLDLHHPEKGLLCELISVLDK
jgi:UDP-2,3-diacylglucosamine pyrophosphatase LpxH